MNDLIQANTSGEFVPSNNGVSETALQFLSDARTIATRENSLRVPISELSTLGAGIASLIPALNTVTQTTTPATDGLYRLANASVGDALKVAKNGNFWGAFKTADGASKFAQLQAVDPISVTAKTVAPINPATMMMAVTMFSIEKQLGKIEEIQKQIISFLEIEKESEIEADVETLTSLIKKYKMNWNNEHFTASNHKLVLDIQRTARKNMNAYQKKIAELVEKKQLLVAQVNVKQILQELEKEFLYYRLSLYTFSLSSFMEIMLSGNFKEVYISGIKDEIQGLTDTYHSLFDKSSTYLEKIGSTALEANILKGVGIAGKAVGRFIGNIPVIKEGPVDEFLLDGGKQLEKTAIGMEKEAVRRFASIHNPETGMFMEQMDNLIQVYNHTEQICFDNKYIYLMPNTITG